MPIVDLVVETPISTSVRARQVCSMFDVPPADKCRLEWHIDLPWDDEPWNVGLIIGPSGSGKSSVMRHVWGESTTFEWTGASVIDDFARGSLEDITSTCSAVGFNTIPAWLRPFAVLSTGEKFRAELARHLLSDADPIVVDEFTSVVDRQVAQIGAHAVAKYVRRANRRFVAVTCHYDVLDWLQPDWVLDMATRQFTRRSLQRRPSVDVEIRRVPYATWRLFAPFHYLTAELHRSARCFALHIDNRPVAFAGILHRPHPKVDDVMGVSRLVTLPDWQGLGLAMVLVDALGAVYKAAGKRLHTYPAHPSLVRSFDRSATWALERAPKTANAKASLRGMGGRPNAVFSYQGPALEDVAQACAVLGGK